MHHSILAELPGRIWEQAYETVDKMSATKVAVIGGAGSGTAITVSTIPDVLNPWLQTASFTVGVLVGVGSLAFILLNLVQKRREMAHWTKKMARSPRRSRR